MLFNYRYVVHDIEKFQAWLDHLVKEVWCKAAGDFSVDLLDDGLKAVVLAIADDNSTEFKLFEPIKDLFDLFKRLSAKQRMQFSQWYDANNNIEALCANSLKNKPVTYSEVALINATLAEQLKDFYSDLWGRVLGLESVKSRIGAIEAHYKAFVVQNGVGKCPYCGYGDIKGLNHTRREAYDHFLPKGIYPFNSVNFKNLAPMCHECNSSYKLQVDPTKHIDPITRKNTGVRRKAFYSYATEASGICIELAFSTADVAKLSPPDITLIITSPGRQEEVESWKDVFGIDERYKAKCCAKYDGMAWLSRVTEENENYGLTRQQMLVAEMRAAENKLWSDANFLKIPFLRACQTARVI